MLVGRNTGYDIGHFSFFFNLVASSGLYFHMFLSFLQGYIAGSVDLQHTADRP